MALQATDIQDLVNTTLNKFGKLKITDLMSDYNNTIALKRTMRKNKMTFDGGPEVEWNLITNTNGSARFVGIGATDVVDIPNVTQRGKVGWTNATWNWAMDGRLVSMNSGSAERIFDIVQAQRLAAAGDSIKLFEQRFWRAPSSSSDNLNPAGLPYWIVKNASEGFNGATPTGFTLVGNINPSTLARWKNWTAPYTTVSKDDLIKKMRRAMWETEFELLVDSTPDYSTGDDYGMYTNYAVLAQFEEIAEAQNDNLGVELASMDGRTMFRKRPISAVKELDLDTTNPVYGVNWGEFKCMALKDWWMRETNIPVKSDQHTIAVTHTDCTFNWFTRNRRRHFVISNGVTDMPAA